MDFDLVEEFLLLEPFTIDGRKAAQRISQHWGVDFLSLDSFKSKFYIAPRKPESTQQDDETGNVNSDYDFGESFRGNFKRGDVKTSVDLERYKTEIKSLK